MSSSPGEGDVTNKEATAAAATLSQPTVKSQFIFVVLGFFLFFFTIHQAPRDAFLPKCNPTRERRPRRFRRLHFSRFGGGGNHARITDFFVPTLPNGKIRAISNPPRSVPASRESPRRAEPTLKRPPPPLLNPAACRRLLQSIPPG